MKNRLAELNDFVSLEFSLGTFSCHSTYQTVAPGRETFGKNELLDLSG